MQLDQRPDQPVAHLLIDAKDGHVRGVVVSAYPLDAELDRLGHSLVFQGAGDAAAANRFRGPGVEGPWKAEHRRGSDRREPHYRVTFACDVKSIPPDAGIVEQFVL